MAWAERLGTALLGILLHLSNIEKILKVRTNLVSLVNVKTYFYKVLQTHIQRRHQEGHKRPVQMSSEIHDLPVTKIQGMRILQN